jgi:hypothetical protein
MPTVNDNTLFDATQGRPMRWSVCRAQKALKEREFGLFLNIFYFPMKNESHEHSMSLGGVRTHNSQNVVSAFSNCSALLVLSYDSACRACGFSARRDEFCAESKGRLQKATSSFPA